MSRNTRAADTLIAQVTERHPKVKIESDDLDGLDVYRTLTFEGNEAVNWLAKGDLALLLDTRVQSAEVDDDGKYRITFVSDIRADYGNPPFSLDAVVAVNDDYDQQAELSREARKSDLQSTPAAELKKQYPEYGPKKADIIASVLADEGL